MFVLNDTKHIVTTRHLQAIALYLLGLALCAVLSASAILLVRSPFLQAHGLSALTLATVLGFILGNSSLSTTISHCERGVNFAKQHLLRLGIMLYGFRLTFQDIGSVGLSGVLIDALVLVSTFSLAVILGIRLFKLERSTALLIGIGSSICGAAAIMAAQPVLKARDESVALAISTVVFFGTLAMFIYPLLYQINMHANILPLSDFAYGVYVGSTIHEVAQVVAAATAISPTAADTAVIVKMVRVMMLAPFLIILAMYIARKKTACSKHSGKGNTLGKTIIVPWFAFIFIAIAGFNSFGLIQQDTLRLITNVDTALLAMAMAGLGLTTDITAICRAGLRPLLTAGLLFAWLVIGGGAINVGLTMLFT